MHHEFSKYQVRQISIKKNHHYIMATKSEENNMPGKAKVHHLFSNKCITILIEGLQPEYQDFLVSSKDQFLTSKLTHWETIFDISVP
jgi:hypothetical protein